MNTAKSSPWPRAIIATFVLLALFDAYIIKQALSTKVATTTDSPYSDALNYEKVIEGKRAAASGEITMSIDSNPKKLKVTFPGLLPDIKRTLTLKLQRPDDSTLDQSFVIVSENNIFTVETKELKRGLWLIYASLEPTGNSGQQYYFEEKTLIN